MPKDSEDRKMKVLFVGYHNPHYETITEYFEKAFREEGCDVIPFDYRKFIFPGRLRQWWPALHRWDSGVLNTRLFELAVRCKPDLTFVNWGGDITPQTMAAIKKATGTKMIFWVSDFPGPAGYFDQSAAKAAVSDFYSAASSDNLESWRRRKLPDGRLVPMACDPDFHKTVGLTEADHKTYDCDVCFVGSYYPNRANELLKIFEAFGTRYTLAIWGPGWKQKLSLDSPLRTCLRGEGLKPSEWCKAYTATKIVLNLHYDAEGEGIKICQAGPRVFEVAACQRFQIVNGYADIVSAFVPDQEIAVFSSAEELVEKTIYYLNHIEERERMAAQSLTKAHSEHTYRHRVKKMLSWLK